MASSPARTTAWSSIEAIAITVRPPRSRGGKREGGASGRVSLEDETAGLAEVGRLDPGKIGRGQNDELDLGGVALEIGGQPMAD